MNLFILSALILQIEIWIFLLVLWYGLGICKHSFVGTFSLGKKKNLSPHSGLEFVVCQVVAEPALKSRFSIHQIVSSFHYNAIMISFKNILSSRFSFWWDSTTFAKLI